MKYKIIRISERTIDDKTLNELVERIEKENPGYEFFQITIDMYGSSVIVKEKAIQEESEEQEIIPHINCSVRNKMPDEFLEFLLKQELEM